jgi:TPR repeat protein
VQKGQHLEAMYQLAWCYETGTGVDADHKTSVLLLKEAARLGHSSANCNLGTLFQMGTKDGLERSIEEVSSFFCT